ncbi:MAG: dihydroorotase [Flavobacteriaceae bacterium]|nr:dihydroorotase [Flavobacteriaceae bacterium]
MKTLLKNAILVNEESSQNGDLLIKNDRIEKIDSSISADQANLIIDLHGKHLLPGLIDDQVHFRQPGYEHKATIETESKAALAGGITSYLEMPNTNPQTTTIDAWNQKYQIASNSSYANYGFMFGGTNDNLEEIKSLDFRKVPALKLFLGSSTGNMLVDNETVLRKIFSHTPIRIALHCEDESTIQLNLRKAVHRFGNDIPIKMHPKIRNNEACLKSTKMAISLAKETGAKIHIFHLSTSEEPELFTNEMPLHQKQITAEVCLHHLWFSEEDYAKKGAYIKWNPAIKSTDDRNALWKALNDDRIDILATDHAPHTKSEKSQPYLNCPSGGPLVQHMLTGLLTCVKKGFLTLEKLVQKAAHNPAILFDISGRGFLREGYYADLVAVDLNESWTVISRDLLYQCQWSPFLGETFTGKVTHTLLNGHLVYSNGIVSENKVAQALTFDRT